MNFCVYIYIHNEPICFVFLRTGGEKEGSILFYQILKDDWSNRERHINEELYCGVITAITEQNTGEQIHLDDGFINSVYIYLLRNLIVSLLGNFIPYLKSSNIFFMYILIFMFYRLGCISEERLVCPESCRSRFTSRTVILKSTTFYSVTLQSP